jgi:alkylation response protein AidB-like acyl-CoA dehydrogenase
MFKDLVEPTSTMEQLGQDQSWDELKKLQRTLLKQSSKAIRAASTIVETDPYRFDLKKGREIVSAFVYELGASSGLALLTGGRIGLHAIAHFGSPELRKKYVQPVLNGEHFISLAISEPTVGTDIQNVKTTAILENGMYIINGVKKWISGGLFADTFVVFAKTQKGYGLFVIDANSPGVLVEPQAYQGAHSSGGSKITFTNVKVSPESVITDSNGLFMTADILIEERWMTGLSALATARTAFDAIIVGTKTRRVHSKPLWSKQLVRSRLASMYTGNQYMDAWAVRITEQIQAYRDKDKSALSFQLLSAEVALFKGAATEHARNSVTHASHLGGGRSYEVGNPIEKLHRIVNGLNYAGGTCDPLNDMAMNVILSKL